MMKRALGVTFVSCLMLQGCNVEAEQRGMIVANAVAIREARKIQNEIAETRKCPDRLAGWESDRRVLPRLVTYAGTQDAQFPLRFNCEKDLTFSILVVYSFDSDTLVSGSSSGPLQIMYGHFTDSRTVNVSSSDDAEVIATKVVREAT